VLTKVDASTEVSGKEPIQLLYVSFHFFYWWFNRISSAKQ
jgi:hypothetical protein